MWGDEYILNDQGTPLRETDYTAYLQWTKSNNRSVDKDFIGEVEISTIFLGLDHNSSKDGPPVLWETMVFVPDRHPLHSYNHFQKRCSGNREQAEAMHNEIVELMEEKIKLMLTTDLDS